MTPPAETDKRQLQDVYADISTDGSPRPMTGAMRRGVFVQAFIRVVGHNLGGIDDRD